MELVQRSLHEQLLKSEDFNPASMEVVDPYDQLVVNWNPAHTVDVERAAASVAEGAAKSMGLSDLPIDVVFLDDNSPMPQDEVTVKGGYGLHYPGSGAVCTAGFSANRGGNLGVVTARHCDPFLDRPYDLRYLGQVGVIANGAAATPGTNGQIDLRFYASQSGNPTVDDFRATPTQDRDVTDVAGVGAWDVICHYGISTEYSCGNVGSQINFCAYGSSWTSDMICGLAQTTEYISSGGDSGGPWFIGTTAQGIHKGNRQTADGNVHSVFTLINRVDTNLNATVMR